MRISIMLPLFCFALTGCDETGTRPREDDFLEETRQLVARAQNQPIPKGHVKVTITRHEFSTNHRSGLGMVMGYRSNSISVPAGKLGANGIHLFAARKGLEAALSQPAGRRTFSSATEQFLLLRENSTGEFAVTRTTPEIWTVVIPVFRGVIIADTIRERVTGTGIKLLVGKASENGVMVQMTPYFHSAEHRGRIELTRLATTVHLVPGTPYVIAADRQSSASFGADFFGINRQHDSRDVAIIMQVEVGGSPDRDPAR